MTEPKKTEVYVDLSINDLKAMIKKIENEGYSKQNILRGSATGKFRIRSMEDFDNTFWINFDDIVDYWKTKESRAHILKRRFG